VTTEEKYIIDFASLKDGVHNFNFTVDNSLIADFSIEGFENVNAEVEIILEKKTGLMTIDFNLTGSVDLICDRCLEICNLPVETDTVLYVREKRRNDEEAENLMFIEPDDLSIDLSHFIYESIIVALPMKRVHPDNEDGSPSCSGEIADMITYEDGDEEDGTEDEIDNNEEQKTDPRWDGLKNIKFD